MRKTEHWTAEEFREGQRTGREPVRAATKPEGPEKKRNKYGNQPTSRGWKRFDSEHEGRIYDELMLRVAAGELRCVARQVKFDLADEEKLQYVADFVIFYPDMRAEVLDAKSPATRENKVYIIKKKLMMERYGIGITEV